MKNTTTHVSLLDKFMIVTAAIAAIACLGMFLYYVSIHASALDQTIQGVVTLLFAFSALSKWWMVTHP